MLQLKSPRVLLLYYTEKVPGAIQCSTDFTGGNLITALCTCKITFTYWLGTFEIEWNWWKKKLYNLVWSWPLLDDNIKLRDGVISELQQTHVEGLCIEFSYFDRKYEH